MLSAETECTASHSDSDSDSGTYDSHHSRYAGHDEAALDEKGGLDASDGYSHRDGGSETAPRSGRRGHADSDRAARLAVRRRPWHLTATGGCRGQVQVGFALLWEATNRLALLNPDNFPSFVMVAKRFFELLPTSQTWTAVASTLAGWALGLTLSSVVGISLGIVIGANRFLSQSTRFMLDVLRSLPAPALLFILILALGTGLTMKSSLIFYAAVFPIMIQTIYGVGSVDSVVADLARTYRLSKADQFFRVRLPSALPFIMTGVRVSASIALVVGVVTEFLGGSPGLGRLVTDVRRVGDYGGMYALILLVGLVGVFINVLIIMVERRLLRWHPSHRRP